MIISAKQARELMFGMNNVSEELKDIFALIERAATKRYDGITTIKISEHAIKYLNNLEYSVAQDKKTGVTYISWA